MKCVIFLILAVCYVNCQKQTLTVSDIEITWENKGNETEFVLKSELGNGVDLEHSWLGIGFGGQMVIFIKMNLFSLVYWIIFFFFSRIM